VKLIAAIPVRNELARYLEPCVAHLLEFCDEIRILDDSSDDGFQEVLRGAWGGRGRRVIAKRRDRSGPEAFNTHAAARNELLQFALDGWPDVILAIDADEFVGDGPLARRLIEDDPHSASWQLEMVEVWDACDDRVCAREDGGWASHPVAMLWRPRMARRRSYRISDQGHATGRTPAGVNGGPLVGECLHFGWAREAEREARYARYSEGDRGRFHASAHIESIAWPASRIRLQARAWPDGLEPWREELLARAKVPA
jgi:hypothetical protein